jgi:Ca-activated chloride channel family protein
MSGARDGHLPLLGHAFRTEAPFHAQSRERYGRIDENPVKRVHEAPVSTFSIDVDTGSYSNVRRMLGHGVLPHPDAVRVEEFINYFPYDYALPEGDAPFAIHTAVARAPWNPDRLILRIALKGQDIARASLPPANLVFLVDVSGSMFPEEKLPLLQAALQLLVDRLRPEDRITLVTYAGTTRVVLPATAGSEKARIHAAIRDLTAGGSTAGASGIKLAYQEAEQNFIPGGINRILLATDGDFNVGLTDFDALKQMVAEKRKTGISLSTLGFGTGNYNEHLMEQLADVGNGAYSYIDTLLEGRKVLIDEMSSTLATIARDVKIQVEFNPAQVREYRLIGYENRLLRREDFNDDKVDAGEIGAGHSVTALYELTPAGSETRQSETTEATKTTETTGTRDLRYQQQDPLDDEFAYVKLRYKQPDGDEASRLIAQPVTGALTAIDRADGEFRFAVAVAGFGQLLRGKADLGAWRYEDVRRLAISAVGEDPHGYRSEFLKLVTLAQSLSSTAVDERQDAR